MDAQCNVARFLSSVAQESPNSVALHLSGSSEKESSSLAFKELDLKVSQLRTLLERKGIQPRDKVLLMLKPGLPLIQVCFALFKMGAVPVVIDPGMGLKSFLNCVAHTQPTALVGIPLAHWVAFFFRRAFASVSVKVKVGRSFQRQIDSTRPSLEPAAEKAAQDLAAILFTSGSTGAPKGVCYGHGQFEAQVGLIRERFGIEPGEIDLPLLPVFALFNPALGMATVVPDMNPSKPASVDPASLIEAIQRYEVSNSFGSPAIWAKVAAYCETTGQRMPSLRRILMAGAPVPPKLFRRLKPFMPNAKLFSPYGATECLPVSVIESEEVLNFSAPLTQQGKGTCVGKVLAQNEVKIIKIEDRPIAELSDATELAVGEVGEIIVTGPTVTMGYYGLDEATQRSKLNDSEGRLWHRMGDCGYLDADGNLWFCGRVAERVLSDKGTFYSDCCEGVFNSMDKVGRSALIGIQREGKVCPAIVIEGEPEHCPTLDALREQAQSSDCTQSIEHFFFDASFPVDVRHNAKIHRLTLAKRFSKG